MRPKPLAVRHLLLAAGALALSIGGVAGGNVAPLADEPLAQPTLRWEQTEDYVKVIMHNPNRTWGFRDQRVYIILRGKAGNIETSYGPDETHRPPTWRPELGPPISCCYIDELAPGKDFVFKLWPLATLKPPHTTVRVAGVTVRPYEHTPAWVRWSDS